MYLQQRSANYPGVIFSVTESPRNPHGKWFRDFFHGQQNPWGFREFHPNYICDYSRNNHGKYSWVLLWMDKEIVRDPRTGPSILQTIYEHKKFWNKNLILAIPCSQNWSEIIENFRFLQQRQTCSVSKMQPIQIILKSFWAIQSNSYFSKSWL